jgi:DNA-binding NarL/FixJ family response regulator
MSEFRILIVEDEPLIAENISMYLNNGDFIVSGIAYDEEEARRQLEKNTPDAVLLDINLDDHEEGIALADFINQRYPIPFLFLTSYSDKSTLDKAKVVKPWGYIVKPFNEKSLLASLEIAISNFAQRANQLGPTLDIHKLNQHLATPLTPREFEILQLIYDGKTNRQIAESLFLSSNTIKKHINNAYLKLQVATRSAISAHLRQLMLK